MNKLDFSHAHRLGLKFSSIISVNEKEKKQVTKKIKKTTTKTKKQPQSKTVKAIEEKLKDLDGGFLKFEKNARRVKEDGKEKFDEVISKFKSQRKNLADKMTHARNKSKEVSGELQHGLNTAVDDLKAGVESAKSKFAS